MGFNPSQKMTIYDLNEEMGVQPETTKKDGVFQPVICFLFNCSNINQRNNKPGNVGFYTKEYYSCK